MYAIFEDGSRQYRVSEGDVVKIDYRLAEVGSTLELTKVLLAGQGADIKVGQPHLVGAKVVAEVMGESKSHQAPPAPHLEIRAKRA